MAALDVERITGDLQVRHADGDEEYLTFGGAVEHPDPEEIVFVDEAQRAHARRWTNRQSGYSAAHIGTTTALIVAEALHRTAAEDVADLVAALARDVADIWGVDPATAVLTADAPRFAAVRAGS